MGSVVLRWSGDIAIAAVRLIDLHGDPADRIIVATSVAAGATLVTADDRILGWPGTLERQDARR
jgi:PIN domain nuclease of toxin-antitoxin system